MSKLKKTNAIRILDKENLKYNILSYEITDGKVDGVSVAKKIKRQPSCVFKTLVTRGSSKEFIVFVIPVDAELNLKKSAFISDEKNIEMISVKDLLKTTGYIKGGCSPIGMKKLFKTFFHKSALDLDNIIVSGGKIGIQIEMNPQLLIQLTKANIADLF